MKKPLAVLAFLLFTLSASAQHAFEGKTVSMTQVGEHSYVHLSYLQTDDFGKVGCNGMVVIKGKKAYIFDTPTTEESTKELLEYLIDEKRLKVVAVIPTHFHDDCLAGLALCHSRGITSVANGKTREFARNNEKELPQNVFDGNKTKLKFKGLGLFYPGEGHTRDNIVAFYEPDQILFGGCLLKSDGASKGYLGDANTSAWSSSVRKVKAQYPMIQKVIPGHGDTAGPELLDYTIQLFETN